LQEVVGGAELWTWQGRHIVGGSYAEGRSRDRQGQQRQYQDLLPPLPAQQPPCPPGHDPSASGAAADGAWKNRRVSLHHAHRCAPRGGRESGPGEIGVGSMTCRSCRSTTRSAHDAICASWVTTTPATPRRQMASISSMTASAFTESRAPVGSSASRSLRS